MANLENISRILTVGQVARLLHVHPNSLRRWSNDRRVRQYLIIPWHDRRFRREGIAHFLIERKTPADN